MTALKIIAVLAALLTLLCLTRVGVVLRWEDSLFVTVRLGLFRIQILPEKKKKQAKKEPEKPKTTAKAKSHEPLPKPGLADIRDAVKTLWPPLKRALDRTRRGIRIDPLDVSVILGGASEPADTAALYGELHGAVWCGMPVLEKLLDIPRPHTHLDVDFTEEKTAVRGTVGVTARGGTLLRIGWTMAVPALKWLLAYRKKHQTIRKDESDGNGKEKPAA